MKKFVLVGIVLLAFLLRVIGLGAHPAGFTPDEASFGYDAYSLLLTGKDQWGESFPLSFRSFGDFKLPLYGYLTIPFVALLGLTETAVRLPNVILGSLAVLATYFLVLEWSKRKDLALISSFLLAISPWHIPMSRGGFEANLTTFLLPLGILLFFKGLKDKTLLIPSALIFGLNLFSYHSARLITPLIVFSLICFNWKELKSLKVKEKIVPLIVFVFFIVLVGWTMIGGGGSRAATSGIFNPTHGWGMVSDQRYGAVLVGLPDSIARIFNNKLTYLLNEFVRNYLSYFSLQFLFTQGANEGTYGMLPGRGLLYLIELVFLIGFLFALIQKKIRNVHWLLFWLLVAPIPAALAKGPGHAANRAVIMLPALSIVSGLGLIWLIDLFKEEKLRKYKKAFVVLISICLIVSFGFFLEDYFFQQPATQAKAMIYGPKQIFEDISQIENQYQEIILSKGISEAQIYVMFYQKTDPEVVQAESKNWLLYEKEGLAWLDQLGTYKLGKYTFKNINYQTDSQKQKTLLIGKPEEFPQGVDKKIIYYPNMTDAYWIVDTSQQSFASNPN